MKRLLLIFIFPLIVSPVHSHEDNESRIKFWKEYYNPKVEVTSNELPTIDISLIKNKPFYQIKTTVNNFNFTPEKNMKNNLPSEGYGKLFINGEYVSRIYSEYHFVKILPVGNNEIKVILSTNLDHDIAVDGKVEIRPMMYLALSYDHRIIDGNQSVGFLIAVKEGVEDPENILMDGKVKKSLGLN